MFILEKTGIASVLDAELFHKPVSSQFVRFCFAKEEGELDEACKKVGGKVKQIEQNLLK